MSDYKVEPTQQESEMDEEEYKAADWDRIITGGSTSIGFGLKGHW